MGRRTDSMVYFKIENTRDPQLASRPEVLAAESREAAMKTIRCVFSTGYQCNEIKRNEAVRIAGEISINNADAIVPGSGTRIITPRPSN